MNTTTQQMMSEFQRQVGDELIEASVFSPTREFSRLQVAQVAKNYQVPIELAEQIAATLLQKQFNVDVDAVDFNNLVKQVSDIENNIADLRIAALQTTRTSPPLEALVSGTHGVLQQSATQPKADRDHEPETTSREDRD